jgi:peroxin-5
MKQLRDRTAMVQGNDIVSAPPDLQLGQGHTVSSVDPKGKGKAIPSFVAVTQGAGASQLQAPSSPLRMAEQDLKQDLNIGPEEDANDAYFRQDNEDYANYWNAHHKSVPPTIVAPSPEWQQLQRDWEKFEATSTGVRPLSGYQFQPGNPYLLGERSANHTIHTQVRSFSESVLQMEAAVQREPNNTQAWFELGVKQQENERERQAISALQQALQTDPTHLPSWLALAISYTNEGDRHGTYEAIRNWVKHNERYRDIVSALEAQGTGSDNEVDEFQKLISCLIAMARGTQGTEVDADVQIALATLLNTNEDYQRARDCFRAALSVRPDDWLLYNRVGATLANGGRAEEALPYYYRALEINPAYIRARFNLGISCINLKVSGDSA